MSESHNLVLDNRNNLSITGGVLHVHSFDNDRIILETSYGFITLSGEDLHIEELNLDKGNLVASGNFSGINYTEGKDIKKKGKSMLGRILR